MINVVKTNIIDFEVNEITGAVALSLLGGNHAFGQTPLFASGFSPSSIQIIDVGDQDRSKKPAIQDALDHFVDEGFTDGGYHYSPLWMGASNARNGEFVCAEDAEWARIYAWASCGLNLSKLPAGKNAKYLALMMSTVKSWHQIFPDGGDFGVFAYPNIEDWAIFKDVEVPAFGLFDIVTTETSRRQLVLPQDGETNKITDGGLYLILDDTKLSWEARIALLQSAEAFTVRAPGIKGCMVPILKSALMAFLKENSLSPEIEDFWGDKVNIFEKKVIAFGSSFKWAKCVKSWQEYVNAFNAYHHKIWVCVVAHGKKWANLPYQQLQTLDCTKEEVRLLATRSAYSTLLNYAKVGKLGKIVGGTLGKILDVYPDLLNDPWIREQLQTSWLSKAKKMYGGRIMKIVHNLFSAMDPVAVFQGVFGLPITGAIAANHCYTRMFKYGKKLGATRNPHLDNAWAILDNSLNDMPKAYRGFFLGTTMFFGAHDNTMKLHQMDFDGDHSAVTDDELLISIAERTRKDRHEQTLLYAAMDASGQEACVDYKYGIRRLCKSAKKAPIGFYVNALTKKWAERKLTPKDVVEMHCLTRKANTCIDEGGGHGTDAAVGLADAVAKVLVKQKKPMFHAYAKGHLTKDGTDILFPSPKERYMFYKNSVADQYSAICRFLIPKRAEQLIDLSGVGKLDTRKLMKDTSTKGERFDKMKDLVNLRDGIFNDIIRQASAEQSLIETSSSMAAVPNFYADKISEIQLELDEYAENRGLSLDDVVDVLAHRLFYYFKNNSNSFICSMKRWFFLVLGDRVLDNVVKNLDVVFEEGEEDYDLADDDELVGE